MQWPDRSTLAAGAAGLAAWAASYELTSLGYPIPEQTILPFTVALMTLVAHIVPDAAKVDQEIKNIAKDLPQTYSAPSDFPAGKGG